MCRVVFQPVLLSEQAGDDLSQGVAYAGGDGAYVQDFEAMGQIVGRITLRHIHPGETYQAGFTVYCELILAEDVPPNYGVPRMSMRPERQSPYRCRNMDIKNRDQKGGVVIGVVSSACCSRTAVSSRDEKFECLGEGDVEAGNRGSSVQQGHSDPSADRDLDGWPCDSQEPWGHFVLDHANCLLLPVRQKDSCVHPDPPDEAG